MKKVVRIMALILAFACLFSGTAFADESEFEAGKVLVGIVKGVNVEDCSALFPEIEIAEIDTWRVYSDGEIFAAFILTEKTHQAVLDAVEALSDNQYIRYAEPNYIIHGVHPVEEEQPPVISIHIKEEIQVENDNYASLFPEIDIALVKYIRRFTDGTVFVDVLLADDSDDAGKNAAAALAENPYVEIAYEDYNHNVFVAATKYYPRDGDVNEDGKLTNLDLVVVARYIIGVESGEGNNIIRNDIDKNDQITNADLIAVARMIVA